MIQKTRLRWQRRKDERLYWAIQSDDVKAAQAALACGANPDARLGRFTMLRMAITSATLPMVQLLVQGGADALAGDPFAGWMVPYSTVAEHYGKSGIAAFLRSLEQQTPGPHQRPRQIVRCLKLA